MVVPFYGLLMVLFFTVRRCLYFYSPPIVLFFIVPHGAFSWFMEDALFICYLLCYFYGPSIMPFLWAIDCANLWPLDGAIFNCPSIVVISMVTRWCCFYGPRTCYFSCSTDGAIFYSSTIVIFFIIPRWCYFYGLSRVIFFMGLRW